ncbi:hypothetical protein MMC17_001740 [Xylographa soralifera]|nr:hypothetical protein [Xylographa soralifera]
MAPLGMLNLMDEPILDTTFRPFLCCGSGEIEISYARSTSTEKSKSLLKGDAEPSILATIKQDSVAVGLSGSRWAVSEEADEIEMSRGQSPFSFNAGEGTKSNTPENKYTGDTAIKDDEAKNQRE